jgi:YHS domain-containing protein
MNILRFKQILQEELLVNKLVESKEDTRYIVQWCRSTTGMKYYFANRGCKPTKRFDDPDTRIFPNKHSAEDAASLRNNPSRYTRVIKLSDVEEQKREHEFARIRSDNNMYKDITLKRYHD